MKHNFGAGPCILPQDVFKEAAAAVLDFNGLSILEVSHRHKDFVGHDPRQTEPRCVHLDDAGITTLAHADLTGVGHAHGVEELTVLARQVRRMQTATLTLPKA